VLTALPLQADSPAGTELRRNAGRGERVAWQLTGTRQCTGIWTGGQRRPCPVQAALPLEGTDPQCSECARNDRGRQIARDVGLGDDGRDYTLYLAWFGTGLVKVGLTATDRGSDRLLEQGAIAWTPAATGPYVPIRRAERLTASTGLARERIGSNAKLTAWWNLELPGVRARQLSEAHDRIGRAVTWPEQLNRTRCSVTDHAEGFGLSDRTPAYSEATAISASAVIAGTIRVTAGHWIMLDTPDGPLLADMRRIAGCQFVPAGPPARPAGLSLAFRSPPRARDEQSALF